jgi:hypothetical protein
MVPRLDDLPAAPARDGPTSPLTPDVISGPIYGTQEFPVAVGRVGAMLFRAGAPDWRSACGNCGNWRFPPVAGNIGGPRRRPEFQPPAFRLAAYVPKCAPSTAAASSLALSPCCRKRVSEKKPWMVPG